MILICEVPEESLDMGVDEFITAGFAVLVGAATTAALYVGLMGMLGAAHVVRCAACNRWTMSGSDRSTQSCPRCDHPVLWHPLDTLGRLRLRRPEATPVETVGAPRHD